MASKLSLWLAALAASFPLTTSAMAAQTASESLKIDTRLGYKLLRAGEKQRVFLRIGLTGIHNPSGSEDVRAPVNIALVIDRSGSMRGAKMEKAREAAIMAVERLTRRDIASVVTFSNGVDVIAPASRVRNHERLSRLIERIRSGGSTAIYAAVKAGAGEIREFSNDRRLDRIILLSDGLANVGPKDPYSFEELGARLGGKGISVTTIGLGHGYNEDLMSQLAAASDGNHDFAETAGDLRRIFNREFDDVLSVIAQDIEIIIETRRGVRPLRGLGRRATIKNRSATFRLSQVYAKSTHSLQVELEVDGDIATDVSELADVRIRYRPHGATGYRTKTASVEAKFSNDRKAVDRSMDPVVMDPVVELLAREKSRKAIKLRDQGRIKAAKDMLDQSRQLITKQNAQRQQFNYKPSKRLGKLEEQYRRDAEAVTERNWNVQRKKMRKSLGNSAGSSVKY
ncbi:MAG: vWA domain-containing protein [Hyphomicrobiaceae bacterium]